MSIRLKLIMFMFAFLAAAAVLGMGALYIFSNLNRDFSLTNRQTTIGYFILLLSFVSLAFIFLALFMRRMLSQPFGEILEATEKVASGDLGYRIRAGRHDEFGLIGERFNRMVERLDESSHKLNARLKETQLLLDVARIAGATPELKEALARITGTVSKELGTEFCAIFLLYPEIGMFVLEAANIEESLYNISLPLDSNIARAVLDSMKPVLIGDASLVGGADTLCAGCKSLIVAPILRDNDCKGILVLGRPMAGGFSPDEKNTAMILAHTTGAVVRNADLYSTTKRQLKQLSVTYELNRQLASVYDPEELLSAISSEIAKLSGARICIIRLLEGGRLNIKSSYGITREEGDSLSEGKGIAGWVAREGRPLFVEDIGKLPEELRPRTIKAKSAICVPLRVGERIIGTLGIYDKAGESGAPKPFDTEDLKMAEGFASMSAIAIEKARMEEEQEARRREVFEANKRLDLLFETVQGGIVSLDSNYRILAANRYVERWVDAPLGEVVGGDAMDVFHPRGGICPHCAARATFDTGDISSITQSNGLNYAELTAYPVKGEGGRVDEVVVFIQDITDRVLYQEEIMGLYREVAQTKEYLESLINNSADAIVTTDLKGNVISWNRAAEEIYGYKEPEVIGRFLPFLPESSLEQEKAYMEGIRRGDIIKSEALRLTKDGALIEVNLTLSPIKDATGEVIGISGISNDITKKKQVERELIRRNQELSRLFFISSAMRGTLDLDRLLRMILTAVTMGEGLGFNRAILFLVDETENVLRGAMGVGPVSPDEAGRIWHRLSSAHSTLSDVMGEIEETEVATEESPFDRLAKEIRIDLAGNTFMARAVRDMQPFSTESGQSPLADRPIVSMLGSGAYAGVPLISRKRVVGVLWVDNLFNKRSITGEDMKFLNNFSNQMASAIENARLFERISMAEAELENIFRSISDMVYLTDKDYNLKKVNEAVLRKVGKGIGEVIGKKCYQIFHGMEEPFPSCPHIKTAASGRSNIEEYEDPYLKGAYLSSTSPLFDEKGNSLGTVHVVRDITEMKQLRERLQSAERMAALGEVAAKVAHEIRNPMVSVGGFAKRLEKKLDGGLKEYASIISSEVDRLELILKEILGFVREVRISRKSTALDELLSGIVNQIGPEVAAKGNVIRQFLSPVSVLIDPDRMKEAFWNVITNANESTVKGTVCIRVYEQDADAVVEITDTGCGIKKDDMVRIFDPFFTTRPAGTGLGLAISKRIVEEHGGRITVKSSWPGGGTGFKIYLPLKKEGL